jgi:hypothetical protein
MAERQVWCRVRLMASGGDEAGCYSLEGYGDPDLTAVDVVARLDLLAGRQDQSLVLEQVSPSMARLLELAGLGVDVQGQTEGREQPRRV